MSFYDDPVVDDNAKRSEESVHYVTGLFSRKNGFIHREEKPDYGVDLDVELILDGIGASSKKFPVQIKSTASLSKVKINNIDFISLAFKTSRLGYLAKRPPAYGIIALYDDTEQVCYFDYVDEIINRLSQNPAREGWDEQESVHILLPLQVLDKNALPALHQKFLARHQNNSLLIQEHGQKFNIPSMEPASAKQAGQLDVNNPAQVANFLEIYGHLLYNESEFSALNHLLGVISRDRLNNSPRLVFLAALTYVQTGNVIEAEHYLRRAKKMPLVMQGEGIAMIEYAAARVEFMKGNVDHAYFLAEFKRAAASAESLENKLNFKINILYFELIKGMETGQFPPNYEKQITELQAEIEAAVIPEGIKHMLRCHNADSQYHFAVRGEAALYQEVKYREAMGMPVPMFEKAARAVHFMKMIEVSDQIVYAAFLYAREHQDARLLASAAHQMGQHFFARSINLIMIEDRNKVAQDKAHVIALYDRNQYYSLLAYNEFLKLNMFQNAHEALAVAYEINQICIYLSGTAIGPNTPEEMLTILREIEAQFDLLPFESGMDKFAENAQNKSGK